MNFLLHRHLALAELGSPAAGIGAMLPDVWRMAERRARAREGVEAAGDGAVVGLLAGVAHHLDADRWFHRSAVFTEGEAATLEALRAERWEASRVALFAHVAWELCLDGALVLERGAEALLGGLRSDLASLDAGSLAEAASRHRLNGSGFGRRVDDLLAAIAAGPWVAGYGDGTGIADRIGGVRRRIGLEPLSTDDQSRLAAILDDRLASAVEALPALLAARPVRPR